MALLIAVAKIDAAAFEVPVRAEINAALGDLGFFLKATIG